MKSKLCVVLLLSAGFGACGSDDDDDDVSGSVSSRVVSVTEVVSDQPGAETIDPTLVNAWGLAFNPAGVAWVSATETGVSRIYDAGGNPMRSSVEIPGPDAGGPSAPTGQVFNDDPAAFQGDLFIFVTEDGLISGWQQTMGGQAVERVNNSARDAVYKGVALARGASGEPLLFAADFRGGRIDVFDASYAPFPSEGFDDADMPANFAPFNVEALDDGLLVAYALRAEDMEDDQPGAGNGYVNLFDLNGSLRARLISGGELNSPWAMVLSPASFAAAPNRLLVGNFGDGKIHVYRFDMTDLDSARAVLEGALLDEAGDDLSIDGLWALEFPPQAGGFNASQLWYTAGPEAETHGVFGRIDSSSQLPGGSRAPNPSPGVAPPNEPSPRPTSPY
jgi:uncharacterized protein (TIGR03118 family)